MPDRVPTYPSRIGGSQYANSSGVYLKSNLSNNANIRNISPDQIEINPDGIIIAPGTPPDDPKDEKENSEAINRINEHNLAICFGIATNEIKEP
jgi:anthranilate/para-aminobenzoate synthase component II